MISRPLIIALLLATASSGFAADDNTPSPNTRQLLKQRLAEEVQSGAAKPVAPPTTPTATEAVAATRTDSAPGVGEKNPLLTAAPGETGSAATKPAAVHAQVPTVMPKVEVKKPRITKLDHELAKEDELIAREKKNAKPSEVDKALNDASIAKPLSIFGGESAQFRQRVSNERVSLMEDEKDLIEAIAHAKTKEEKAELQKQLDALRDERRELERALR